MDSSSSSTSNGGGATSQSEHIEQSEQQGIVSHSIAMPEITSSSVPTHGSGFGTYSNADSISATFPDTTSSSYNVMSSGASTAPVPTTSTTDFVISNSNSSISCPVSASSSNTTNYQEERELENENGEGTSSSNNNTTTAATTSTSSTTTEEAGNNSTSSNMFVEECSSANDVNHDVDDNGVLPSAVPFINEDVNNVDNREFVAESEERQILIEGDGDGEVEAISSTACASGSNAASSNSDSGFSNSDNALSSNLDNALSSNSSDEVMLSNSDEVLSNSEEAPTTSSHNNEHVSSSGNVEHGGTGAVLTTSGSVADSTTSVNKTQQQQHQQQQVSESNLTINRAEEVEEEPVMSSNYEQEEHHSIEESFIEEEESFVEESVSSQDHHHHQEQGEGEVINDSMGSEEMKHDDQEEVNKQEGEGETEAEAEAEAENDKLIALLEGGEIYTEEVTTDNNDKVVEHTTQDVVIPEEASSSDNLLENMIILHTHQQDSNNKLNLEALTSSSQSTSASSSSILTTSNSNGVTLNMSVDSNSDFNLTAALPNDQSLISDQEMPEEMRQLIQNSQGDGVVEEIYIQTTNDDDDGSGNLNLQQLQNSTTQYAQVYIVENNVVLVESQAGGKELNSSTGSLTDSTTETENIVIQVQSNEEDADPDYKLTDDEEDDDEDIEQQLEKFEDLNSNKNDDNNETMEDELILNKKKIPCHVLGRNVENPLKDNFRNGKVPPKPRLGVKIPNRNLTSQIVTRQEVEREVMKRNKLKQDVSFDSPQSTIFAKKLTHRLAKKIANTSTSNSTSTSLTTGNENNNVENSTLTSAAASSSGSGSGSSSTVVNVVIEKENNDVKEGILSQKEAGSTAGGKIQNNSDLLAILEGDGDEITANESQTIESNNENLKDLEKQIALKQLQEMSHGRRRGRSKMSELTSQNVVKTTQNVVKPSLSTVPTLKAVIKSETNSPGMTTRSQNNTPNKSGTSTVKDVNCKSELPSSGSTTGGDKEDIHSFSVEPKFSKKLAIKTYSRKRKNTTDEEEDLSPEIAPAPVTQQQVAQQQSKTNNNPVYVTKSLRVIKKKVIWDPAEAKPTAKLITNTEKIQQHALKSPEKLAQAIKEKVVKTVEVKVKSVEKAASSTDKDKEKEKEKVEGKTTRGSERKLRLVDGKIKIIPASSASASNSTTASAASKEVKEEVEPMDVVEEGQQQQATASTAATSTSSKIPKKVQKVIVVTKSVKNQSQSQSQNQNPQQASSSSSSTSTSVNKSAPKIKSIKIVDRKKKLTEIDKLLMDEGAIKMLYDIKNPDENQNTSKSKKQPSFDKEKAHQDLLNKSYELKNDLQNNISPKSLRRKEVQNKTPAGVSRQKSKDSNRSSVHSPPASPQAMVYPEQSCIIRRHSSSSYSSSENEEEGNEETKSDSVQNKNSTPTASGRVLRRKCPPSQTTGSPKSKRVRKEVTITTNSNNSSKKKSDEADKKFNKLTQEDPLSLNYKHLCVKHSNKLVEVILQPSMVNQDDGKGKDKEKEKKESSNNNKLNSEVLKELTMVLKKLDESEDFHVILLSSSGHLTSPLCRGINYNELIAKNEEERKKLATELATEVENLVKTLAHSKKVTVAAVQGAVEGFGVMMLPLFDMVYASETATFSTPYGKLGCAPEAGCLFSHPRLLGNALVSELLYSSRKITTEDARILGLVTRVLPEEKFEEEVLKAAKQVATCSPNFLQASKRIMQSSIVKIIEENLEADTKLLVQHWTSPECQKSFSTHTIKQEEELNEETAAKTAKREQQKQHE